jgi:hypothetical protein
MIIKRSKREIDAVERQNNRESRFKSVPPAVQAARRRS